MFAQIRCNVKPADGMSASWSEEGRIKLGKQQAEYRNDDAGFARTRTPALPNARTHYRQYWLYMPGIGVSYVPGGGTHIIRDLITTFAWLPFFGCQRSNLHLDDGSDNASASGWQVVYQALSSVK